MIYRLGCMFLFACMLILLLYHHTYRIITPPPTHTHRWDIVSGAFVTEKHIASPGVWIWVLLHAIRLSTNQANDNPLTRAIRNAIISNISTFHKIWKLLVLIILSEDKKQNYFYIYTIFYTVNCSAMLMHIKYVLSSFIF